MKKLLILNNNDNNNNIEIEKVRFDEVSFKKMSE